MLEQQVTRIRTIVAAIKPVECFQIGLDEANEKVPVRTCPRATRRSRNALVVRQQIAGALEHP